MLDNKRSKLFVWWYQDRYGKLDKLPELPAEEEEREYQVWAMFIKMLCRGMRPRKYRWKTLYIYILDKLWMNYWPVFITNQNKDEI